MPTPQIVRTIDDLRSIVKEWKGQGYRVGLVPTMGALHHGHLSLIEAIAKHCDRIIVSIFVNPKQFDENKDLDEYPREEQKDLQALANTACQLVFAPSPREVYPNGFTTNISVGGLTETLEGANRPGHFDGVATVVTKLMMMSSCDVSIYGEKDYQQLAVVRRFVKDLNLPVQVLGGTLIREKDGLAASSRNVHLSASERKIAGNFNVILKQAIADLHSGLNIKETENKAIQALLNIGFSKVDYVSIVDPESLIQLENYTKGMPARIVAVARIRTVRLLDNMAV